MPLKSYSTFLSESLTPAALPKAMLIITRYLRKKLVADVFALPEPEKYRNTFEKGFGARFFVPRGNRSFRLNWSAPSKMGMVGLKSVDVWLDSEIPFHVEFDEEISLVKTLPLLVDLLKTKGMPKLGVTYLPPEGIDLLKENVDTLILSLMEAVNPNMDEVFYGVLGIIQEPNFKKGDVWTAYKGAGLKVFDGIASAYPHLLVKSGISYSWKGTKADATQIGAKGKEAVFASIGSTKAVVSKGSANETIASNPLVDKIEADMDRLSYEMQLKDLENLIRLTVGGSSNALFIAGRGGIGKTHSVEKVLGSLGLSDGNGYFKNTGTASAAGIYALLFKNRNGIILFDDSDDALKDQEARNIFKAATDTKKVRKLVWNKMGKNVVEPGDMEDDEMIEQGLLPRFFEFTGKIIFISNLAMDKLDPDGAIRTRAYLIDINPTDAEVYDFMEKIAGDIPLQDGLSMSLADRLRVVSLIRSGKSKQTANLRVLSRGLSMAAAGASHGVSDAELQRMIRTYA
jgi:hypothetical protein